MFLLFSYLLNHQLNTSTMGDYNIFYFTFYLFIYFEYVYYFIAALFLGTKDWKQNV